MTWLCHDRSMIISHLFGGLGNQMFQYAMGRQVSLRLGVPLRLDLFSYRFDRQRSYGLEPFRVQAERAHWRDISRISPTMALARLLPRPLYERGWKILARAGIRPACRTRIKESAQAAARLPLAHGRVIAERQLTYDPDIFQVRANALLVGCWHNQAYFREIRGQLQEDFTLKSPPSPQDEHLIQNMREENSVSMHVRRGDKVGHKIYKATSLEFCLQAMDLLRGQMKEPRFFVFSDDAAWTLHHLGHLPNVTLVQHHAQTAPHEDLRLMRACRHQIIASSSFSWWGAWLEDRAERIVISPPASHWVQGEGYDTREILPSHWQIIDAVGD